MALFQVTEPFLSNLPTVFFLVQHGNAVSAVHLLGQLINTSSTTDLLNTHGATTKCYELQHQLVTDSDFVIHLKCLVTIPYNHLTFSVVFNLLEEMRWWEFGHARCRLPGLSWLTLLLAMSWYAKLLDLVLAHDVLTLLFVSPQSLEYQLSNTKVIRSRLISKGNEWLN